MSHVNLGIVLAAAILAISTASTPPHPLGSGVGKAMAAAKDAVKRYHEAAAARGDGQAAWWLAEHSEGGESVRWLEVAANRGVPVAFGILAWRYEVGHDVTKDDAASLKWVTAGVKAGDTASFEGMADRLRDGRGVRAALPEALALYAKVQPDEDEEAISVLLAQGRPFATFGDFLANLRSRSEAGDGTASYALYTLTYERFGIPAGTLADALPYCVLAAEQGHAEAQNELGNWYLQGADGALVADRSKAFTWFLRASSKDYAPAMISLAHWWESAPGSGRDPDQVMKHLRAAAMTGDANAQIALAERLATGMAPGQTDPVYPVDFAESLLLLRKAANQGHAQAMYFLALHLLDGRPFARDPGGAARWLEKAEGLGHTDAMGVLARLHEDGVGVERNLSRAFALNQKAGLRLRVGHAYRDGRGVAANPVLALERFIDEAEARVDEPAEVLPWLGMMFEAGQGVARDESAARALYAASHTAAGEVLLARLEESRPGATLQSRLEAYRDALSGLLGQAFQVPADPARALGFYRKAVADYLERFEYEAQ
ncbi:MAG: sel1 repeat family protein [Candidatus Sericytochromatia bacterium]|uniref:Sel1 repeat family protein n=1 Tax=Candidatus Tanganyikabacteria bacterium TaxID=2961651 RepID=A0A937X214_9BACT|nr:sel1 repeat family protein [Candidatus Tanganyikabacteria bacterium]